MTGKDLIDFIKMHPVLAMRDVSEIIKVLLKEGAINPSTLIDAHTSLLREETNRYKMHYIEGNVAANLVLTGSARDKEKGRKRLMFNALADPSIVYSKAYDSRLTAEEKAELNALFELHYGFKPKEA